MFLACIVELHNTSEMLHVITHAIRYRCGIYWAINSYHPEFKELEGHSSVFLACLVVYVITVWRISISVAAGSITIVQVT